MNFLLIFFTVLIAAVVVANYFPFGLVDMLPFIKVKHQFYKGNVHTDYDDEKNWFIRDEVHSKTADTFFVHRTTYLRGSAWNAPSNNKLLDLNTYHFSVKVQAQIFQEMTSVYAPKYKQATLYSFYDESENGISALDFSYQEIKKAFEHYLINHNQGKPFFIVGHSQGAFHLQRLLVEFFDQDEKLRKQLICAYLVGMPIQKSFLKNIGAATLPHDVNCFVSWSTFGKKASPRYFKERYPDSFCINPITWLSNNSTDSGKKHKAITYYFNCCRKTKIDVFIQKGFIHVSRMPLGFLRLFYKDYVAVDFHIFYESIRENVKLRMHHYYEKYK